MLSVCVLCVQVEVDEGKVEISGRWDLASPLLPLTVNGRERTLQVADGSRIRRIIPQKLLSAV